MKTVYDNGKYSWEHGSPIYEDGQVVRRMLGPCPLCGSPTSSYGGGFSCHNRYCPCSADQFVCSAGPIPTWWDKGINVQMDGNLWCATGPGFINLQESNAGFGKTPRDAVDELMRDIDKSQGAKP